MDAGIYRFAKRVCVTSGATHKIRIGLFQIRGAERKKHMKAYDEETSKGKVDLAYGRIEHMLDGSEKMSELTWKQYSDWKR